MKLKDILKTDTDNKGWLRVFKKLGADAEMLKYVNENISKSGGGSGEGVKEYYYKILSHTNDQGMSTLYILSAYGLVSFNTCIYNGKKINYIMYNNYGNIEAVHVSQYIVTMDNKLQAFSYLDLEVQLYSMMTNVYLEIPKGNLYDRLETIVSLEASSEEEKAQMKEMLNTMYLNYFQEITKEEYESLITQ